jgi:hypothetical protein
VRIANRAHRSWFTVSAALSLSAVAIGTVSAQDVQYRSVSKLDMGTGINLALKLAGASEVSSTTYIKGRKMRTESDKSATIFDLDKNRVIIINNGDKTYISAPISQMTAAFSELTANANVRADKGQMTATARDSAGNKADFTFHVSIDPTNEHQEVNGQDATRSFATIQTDVKVTPEGESAATDAGTLVILVDNWSANGGAAYTAVHNFQQAMSKGLREQAFSNMKGFNAAFAQNPQMGEAMQKAAAEQQKMDGIMMRSTTYLVAVPPSLKFDRDLVIKPQEGGGGSVAKRAMGGMLSGALRSRMKQQEEKKDTATADPKQATVMKMTTEIRDVQTTSLPSSLFEVPAGYREIPFTPPTRK